VTGVQTCALPIWRLRRPRRPLVVGPQRRRFRRRDQGGHAPMVRPDLEGDFNAA
jgi:hypothetical protein